MFIILKTYLTYYNGSNKNFFHSIANNGKCEQIRNDIHANNVEKHFNILKCGITGVYQHVGE